MKGGAALGSAWTSALGHHWGARKQADQIEDGLWGAMDMRKSYRWLGCVALLCFTAVELSGCSSKPLISGIKWPGRKDRDAAVTEKDKSAKTGGDEELLVEARKYEKAGDFTNASKKYREYLEGGGQPVESSRAPKGPVAKSKKPTPDKEKSIAAKEAETDAKSPIRPTAKTKKTDPKETKVTRTAEVEQDPWANQSVAAQESEEFSPLAIDQPTRPATKRASPATPKPKRLDADETPAETPPWAELGAEAHSETPDTALSSRSNRQAPRGVTEDDLEDLLDLDEGEIDWGDTPKQLAAKGAGATPPATDEVVEEVEPTETENVSGLPLVDLHADDHERLASTALTDADAIETENAVNTWHSHEGVDESVNELTSANTEEVSLSTEQEFVPPALDDSAALHDIEVVEEVGSATPQSLALTCQDCEPWLYAQVTKLDSTDAEIRKEGLIHLADMGSSARQAGLAVRTLLNDSDPRVQAHAAWALWVIENDPWDSVTTLRPLLDHSSPEVVELVCYMLGDIGVHADSATDPLELLRDHADGQTQVQAAEALIRIRGVDEKSLVVLTTALKSRSGEDRWIAAVALGHCRGPKSAKAVTALTLALKDVDPEVRSAAALSLGGLGSDAVQATAELERVARTDDAQVRDAAHAALACLKR